MGAPQMTGTIERASTAVIGRIVSIEAAAPLVSVVRVRPDDAFDWRAGQFAALRFPDFEIRNYSISNRPGEGEIEFHIRDNGGGVGAHVASTASVGDPVEIAGPFGSAYFRRRHGGPLLAIAGGTGLAPMKAIVEDALATGHAGDVHLYFGVRDEPDIYLEQHFIALTRAHLNFRFVTVLAEPGEPTGRRHGLVGAAVAADFQLLYGYQCYVAGPPAMVQACRDALRLKSVPAHDIFADDA